MNNSELTDKARGIARTLTYNDDAPQAQAKHMLLEMARRIDRANTRVGASGKTVRDALGSERPMTIRERLLYLLFGVVPSRAGVDPRA